MTIRMGNGMRRLAAALLLAGAATAAHGEAGIWLGGPEVFAVDWNTRSLTPCDLDDDGRLDLALVNNDLARIDLLYQRSEKERESADAPAPASGRWEPVLSDGRFRRVSVVTGQTAFALAVGDLDDDGRTDLVYTGNPVQLTVRYQDADGGFERERELAPGTPVERNECLQVADLDGDDRDDIILLTETELVVLRQQDGGDLSPPERYALAGGSARGLQVRDLDGDGRVDVIYQVRDGASSLRYRLQDDGGVFGPESSLRAGALRSTIRPVRVPGEDAACFAGVQDGTGMIDVFRVAAATAPAGEIELQPRVFATGIEGRVPASYGLGDLDGDGRRDVCVGDGGGAQVWVYLQDREGRLAQPRAYPSLSQLRSLAVGDLNGDGRDEVVVISSREESIGVSRLDKDGRLEFPEPLAIEGAPYAAAVADLDGDGRAELAVARKRERDHEVVILTGGRKGPQLDKAVVAPLPGARSAPAAVEVWDANQDGRPDLLVYAASGPLSLLVQQDDGTFSELGLLDGFRRGLVDELSPAATSLCDVDGDGKDELLTAGKGFVRALRLDAAGALTVVEQINANENAALAAALGADLDGDGELDILACEAGGESMQVLSRDEQGVFRYRRSHELGRIDLVDALATDLDGRDGVDLLLLGRTGFWWAPVGGRGLGVRSLALIENDLPDHTYGDLDAGALAGDGRDFLVTVDGRMSSLMEIVAPPAGADGAWTSLLHFPVYEENPHYRGRTGGLQEPREVITADVTGDGRDDVLLLVHDRVLLYPVLD
jgi:hypothetical protein